MLDHVRIVLVNPSHPGNIGAVARAMKNMGLSRLCLVAPVNFPHQQALDRAAGAEDILAQASIYDELAQALAGCQFTYAASARSRRLEWAECNARQCAQQIVQMPLTEETALVFGRESSGLTNEELAQCQSRVYIPTDEQFSSLNLAAAVQVLVYELRMAWLLSHSSPLPSTRILAPHEAVAGFYQHLETTLIQLKFLNPKHPKKLMQRLQRLFNRAQMEMTEVNILRGILTSINKLI